MKIKKGTKVVRIYSQATWYESDLKRKHLLKDNSQVCINSSVFNSIYLSSLPLGKTIKPTVIYIKALAYPKN